MSNGVFTCPFPDLTRWLVVFTLLVGLGASAQEDTLSAKIFDQDDLDDSVIKRGEVVVSANLLAENADELPQDIIVISGDEIRRKGYSTLVDVLKSLPGFRTSQPGNGLEGEGFLMRGLYGNDHAKILVNGIPIKPEAVRGMPIASQLPIRHAERIEIVNGPSAAAYGSDAMAGVINIVLPEIDRPVFAWADINLMTSRISEFNLTLGGKVGSGKNILNYQLFASSSQAVTQPVLIPEDSIRLEEMPGVDFLPFYVPEEDDSLVPEIEMLPKESRLVGAYLKFRWFELGGMTMYRVDHSGIGYHPLDHSYHASNDLFGEDIATGFFKITTSPEKRFQYKANFSGVFYRTIEESSYWGVDHLVSVGKNYSYARSMDLRTEHQFIQKFSRQMNLVLGGTAQYAISHAYTDYLWRPFRYDDGFIIPSGLDTVWTAAYGSTAQWNASDLDSVTYIPTHSTLNVAALAQFSYRSKDGKFMAVAGTRIDLNSVEAVRDEAVFTPKIGLSYMPSEKWKLRAFYGSGYRAPRSYYIYNKYTNTASAIDSLGERLERRENPNLQAERLSGGEIGITWKPNPHWQIDGMYYSHQFQNRLILQRWEVPPNPPPPGVPPPPPGAEYGSSFENIDAYSWLHSGILNVRYRNRFGKVGISGLLSYQYAKGTEIVEATQGSPNTNVEAPGYRQMPENMFKANLDIEAYGFTVSITNQVFGNYLSEVYRVNSSIDYERISRYFHNMDISIHKVLFRQLSVVGSVTNVLNTVQSGIPGVTLSDPWSFNPQNGRIYRIGLTFKLN